MQEVRLHGPPEGDDTVRESIDVPSVAAPTRRSASLDTMRAGDVVADRFEVERQAGAGGMGIVYRAKDRLTGEPVALKVIAGRTTQESERFLREAALLAELRHPSIVRHVAHGTTTSGERYLAM